MSTSATVALARLLADAATTIELADDEAISLDLAAALLEDLAAGCDGLPAEDRAMVGQAIHDYALQQRDSARKRVMLELPTALGLADDEELGSPPADAGRHQL
jgi:hypothetical protein